eukprot:m.302627 g.302627  ORF g.302627 m.302627 type:complete len:57 (-) comp19580_c1_seq7:1050-1220(-)
MDDSIESSPAVSEDGTLAYFATYQGYVVAVNEGTVGLEVGKQSLAVGLTFVIVPFH